MKKMKKMLGPSWGGFFYSHCRFTLSLNHCVIEFKSKVLYVFQSETSGGHSAVASLIRENAKLRELNKHQAEKIYQLTYNMLPCVVSIITTSISGDWRDMRIV